jgi:Fe-S-cluster containining protein
MTPKARYDCARCPGYCCSYELIEVTERDVARLARHFGLRVADAWRRFTKLDSGRRVLRHRRDHVYRSTCRFFDQQQRRCTVYEARPAVCRQYPETRCGYYDFLRFEREQQGDDEFVPGTPRSARGMRMGRPPTSLDGA